MPLGYTHHRISMREFPYTVDSKKGRINITEEPTLLAVGDESMENRKALYVLNDASFFLYINDKEIFDIEDGDYIWLWPGQTMEIILNGRDIDFYAKVVRGEVIIPIFEEV